MAQFARQIKITIDVGAEVFNLSQGAAEGSIENLQRMYDENPAQFIQSMRINEKTISNLKVIDASANYDFHE